MGQHNKLTIILPISNKPHVNLVHVAPPQSVVLSPQYSQFLGEALKVFLKILDDGEPQFIAEQNMQVSGILSVCLSVCLSLNFSPLSHHLSHSWGLSLSLSYSEFAKLPTLQNKVYSEL